MCDKHVFKITKRWPVVQVYFFTCETCSRVYKVPVNWFWKGKKA
jgi:hypothetical protein